MRFFKWSIFLLTAVSLLMAGPAAGQAADKIKLKIAQTVYPEPSAHMDSVKRIAEKATKRTDGRITFKIYGPELCDWSELNEMVNRGDIDIMLSPISPTYDPRWNAVNTPYLVTTYEDAKKAYGPGGFMEDLFKTWAKDINMHWLGSWFQGFTGASLNKEATSPEAAKGVKVRTPPIGVFECYWEAMGFTPSLIPYSEVPTAISTGVVDGQAGGGPFQTWSCCRDLNKYFIFYRDCVELWGYTMNLDAWNKLSPEDQKVIGDVVAEEAAARVAAAQKEDREFMANLKKHGLTVIDMIDHPEKMNAFKDNARTCWDELDKIVGKVWMDKIRQAVGVAVK